MMKEEKSLITLAALLHDIGKFMQRAEVTCRKFNDENEMQQYCRYHSCKNIYTHKHALWTAQFMEDSRYILPDHPNVFDSLEENLTNFAARHHKPATELDRIISKADRLSSGMDRKDKEEEAEIKRWDAFKRIPLNPLLEEINLNDERKSSGHRIDLKAMALDGESVFPVSREALPEVSPVKYAELWERFQEEFEKLKGMKLYPFVETLNHLLEKYTWCIPSSTMDLPDIPLYDHAKTTAAIAACLYDYHRSPDALRIGSEGYNDVQQFLLVCGDISGIQNFIYTITSEQAAKSLKGRSFLLQLITDAAAQLILNRTGYHSTNLLYSGGGRFYLLVSKNQKNVDVLEKTCEEINRNLYERYGIALFLAVGWSCMSSSDLMLKSGNLPERWGEAARKANEEKRRKFVNLKYEELFEPEGEGGIEYACEICRSEKEVTVKRKDDSEIKLCVYCNQAVDIGAMLSRTRFIAQVYGDHNRLPAVPGLLPVAIPVPGMHYFMSSGVTPLSRLDAEQTTIYAVNDTEFMQHDYSNKTHAFGFKFEGGAGFTRDETGRIPDFNNMIEQSAGLQRLGVLRMDVDNLGQVFKKGFGQSASISRITGLSRNISLFFSGCINRLCRNEPYKGKTLIIYSGGDDLFIVGAWSSIPELAAQIKTEFSRYCCGNSDMTLSGGIALIGKKYPIYRGAVHAGEAEEKAKQYEIIIKGRTLRKNALTFLGKSLNPDDFEIAAQIKNMLHECMKSPQNADTGASHRNQKRKLMPASILNRLRNIYLLYMQNKTHWIDKAHDIEEIKEKVEYNKWVWRMVYSLNRALKENPAYSEKITGVLEALQNNKLNGKESKEKIIEFIDVPVRWTEFLLRKQK